MKRYLYKVKKIAENLGWNVTIDDEDVTFQRYSGAGQDFFFSVKIEDDMESFFYEVYEYYEGFDVSYEAYLWLDNTGHGQNGAPYEMIDVYNDMKECEEEIEKLWQALREEA